MDPEGNPPLAGIDAVIFDTDGVITDTASVHAAAWKQMFDEYLARRAGATGEPFHPFDADAEYRRYLDGRPREDGVQAFLQSRGIELPYGDPQDSPDQATVCGLGNRKTALFLAHLKKTPARAYPSAVAFVRTLRASGKRSAVISASRNCLAVLQSAGVQDLFDVRVDGVAAAELGLRGKPEPDVFLEAARRLGVDPPRIAVVEDALAGVEAGQRGGFGLVIGVDRGGHAEELRRHGADIVVADLGEIAAQEGEGPVPPLDKEGLPGGAGPVPLLDKEGLGEVLAAPQALLRPLDELPSALTHEAAILARLGRSPSRAGEGPGDRSVPAVFLDYDGTLTPIVVDPAQALLPRRTRQVMARLARYCPVAILSGRDVADVRRLVALEGIVYAGSHGFDVIDASGAPLGEERWQRFLPALDAAQHELEDLVTGIPGARVERKRFAIALHYRLVDDAHLPALEQRLDRVGARHRELRKTGGKKVFELRPDVDWDKGRVLLSLEAALARQDQIVPLFIGDDLTDEDGFRAIRGRGIAIVVGDEDDRATAATYRLRNPAEVQTFLARLASWLAHRGPQ